jgi:hypothetical protein
MRAAHAATNPAVLGAADTRWGLPGCGFVQRSADCAKALRPASLSGRLVRWGPLRGGGGELFGLVARNAPRAHACRRMFERSERSEFGGRR